MDTNEGQIRVYSCLPSRRSAKAGALVVKLFQDMPTGFEKLVAEAKKNITEISPTEAAAKSESGEAVIVDVREKDEWDEEHIPDATSHESWHHRARYRRKSG